MGPTPAFWQEQGSGKLSVKGKVQHVRLATSQGREEAPGSRLGKEQVPRERSLPHARKRAGPAHRPGSGGFILGVRAAAHPSSRARPRPRLRGDVLSALPGTPTLWLPCPSGARGYAVISDVVFGGPALGAPGFPACGIGHAPLGTGSTWRLLSPVTLFSSSQRLLSLIGLRLRPENSSPQQRWGCWLRVLT